MAGEVRLLIADTGDILEWRWEGVDLTSEPWEQSALDIALAMVPPLMDAIDRAHINGQPAVVKVSRDVEYGE